MQIKILGTRGEIKPSAPGHANHSGIILDNRIMFDLGEEKFLREKPEYIFITHLHPDHAFFARENEPLKTEAEIFAPERREGYPQIKPIVKPLAIGMYKITPLPTIHSKKVKSQAYLIEAGGKKILYTGDMIWIKKQFWKSLKNLDLVITEGSFVKSGGMVQRDKTTGELWGHQGIPDLIKFFSQFTKRIILAHFGSWFYKDMEQAEREIKKIGKSFSINIKVGYDGMKINL